MRISHPSFLITTALLAALTFSAEVYAEITHSTAEGFVSEHTLLLEGTPTQVYQALTVNIDRWWDAEHSYSGKPENFSLDAEAGGCFCEKLDNGGSVEHMRVGFANPGRQLRLLGGLGPLQAMAVNGSMDFILKDAGNSQTELAYRYGVGGYVPGGLTGIAATVDQVQLGQLRRLQHYLMTGSPTP
jgi:hypothetical protein